MFGILYYFLKVLTRLTKLDFQAELNLSYGSLPIQPALNAFVRKRKFVIRQFKFYYKQD